jgi:hypothetical protein
MATLLQDLQKSACAASEDRSGYMLSDDDLSRILALLQVRSNRLWLGFTLHYHTLAR